MSVNSSSPSNDTLFLFLHCFDVSVVTFISVAFTVTKLLLILPLSILVLHLGHQQWRQQRSLKAMSHSDVFSFHMAAMQLISGAGWGVLCCGSYMGLPEMTEVGFYAFYIIFPGETLFHILTCVERYLAVVQPITYRRLRQSGGVRIRNIGSGCVWLMCLAWIGVTALHMPDLPIFPFLSFLILALLVVSFCSLSVLHVLIRPGPGDVGGEKGQVDQSKQRAFYTIVIIMAVLWLLFVGILVCFGLGSSSVLSYSDACVILISAIWFNLPSSLVLPLLFLHRAGKWLFCTSCAK